MFLCLIFVTQIIVLWNMTLLLVLCNWQKF